MKSIKPVNPNEAIQLKKEVIPQEVIEAFNELIAQNFDGYEAVIKQKDVVELMVEKGLSRGEIFRRNWLDIEPIYELAGWKVVFDKPAYNETYEATFTFSIRV